MGTCYYAITVKNPCDHCGRKDTEEYHIGKSSFGWCFTLHVEPERGIKTLQDVYAICEKAMYLKDEYGREVSLAELKNIIEERSGQKESWGKTWDSQPWSAFLEENHAVEGPNYLLRHRLDGYHCIGHGGGTWDYITGEFS